MALAAAQEHGRLRDPMQTVKELPAELERERAGCAERS
jgi:hypothetical protein